MICASRESCEPCRSSAAIVFPPSTLYSCGRWRNRTAAHGRYSLLVAPLQVFTYHCGSGENRTFPGDLNSPFSSKELQERQDCCRRWSYRSFDSVSLTTEGSQVKEPPRPKARRSIVNGTPTSRESNPTSPIGNAALLRGLAFRGHSSARPVLVIKRLQMFRS